VYFGFASGLRENATGVFALATSAVSSEEAFTVFVAAARKSLLILAILAASNPSALSLSFAGNVPFTIFLICSGASP